MSNHDFLFALEVSCQGAPATLVEDLALNIFRHVGCDPERADGLRGAVERAAEPSALGGVRRCDVQFRAHDGQLDVLVSSNGGRVWQTTIVIS